MEIKMQKHVTIYTDGGSRGNPGPAAIAFLIQCDNGKIQKSYSNYIGIHTNNQAEYKALIAAMQFILKKAEEITCYLDSELVVKQINGLYSVKNLELRNLWNEIKRLKECFKKTVFISVPRTNYFIKKADWLLNKKLNEKLLKYK
jgi:ribonuclease HI